MAGILFGTPALRAAVPPAQWMLPPLDGDLAGEFDATLLGGAPKLQWKLTVRTTQPRERSVEYVIEGYGLRLQGDARLDPMGEGTWRVAKGTIDLGVWFGWVGARLGPAIAGVVASGALTFDANGTWRDRVLDGAAKLSLREGRFDDPGRKVMLEGISVDVEIEDLATLRTAPAQVFTWRSGRYDVVPLGVGRIEFALDKEKIRVTSALIDVFGGELQIGSLVMATKTPEFAARARLVGIAVDQIVHLLPEILSEAHGKLDGYVALRRTSRGIQIGNGHLKLREGETADLRLAVKPGWLSSSLPPQLLTVFPGFRKMETGEVPIRARVLEITFTPLGDEKGRTAVVTLAGGPSDPALTAPVDMSINVRGPLDTVVNIGAGLGTDSRLNFGGVKIE